MWGLTINDKHTFDDFGLCCLSCTLDPPEPRLYTIDIPGADGVLDATAARGRVTYKNRTLTAEFDCVYESRTSYDAACAGTEHGAPWKACGAPHGQQTPSMCSRDVLRGSIL